MKRIIFLLSTLALTLSLVSCQKELRDVRLSGALTYSVEAAEWDNASEFPTKSAFFTDADYNVTDCNIWVYEAGDNTGEPVNTQSYFETLKNVDGSKLFPDPFKSYDFFMFANVGQIAAPATLAAAKEFKHDFTSVTKFYEKGFPMASSYYSFSPATATSGTLLVKKLVSQYNVKFDFTDGGNNDYDFILKSAAIKQSAKTIRPFMQNDDGVEESAAKDKTEVEETADMLSLSDVSDAISGKGVRLYMIENVLGKVFKEDVRIPDNLSDLDQERATYIEFVGSLDKRDGTGYHSVTCRYYFGKGRRAEVKRNYITDVQLNLKNTILDGHDNWTVEPADPYNNSWVRFNPSSLSITGNNSFTSFYTTTGVDEEAGNEKVKYYIDYNSSDYSAAGLTLQYSKTENGSYSNYTKGTELVGQYYFKVKSNYTGSTQKTVKLSSEIEFAGEKEVSGTLDLNVYPFTGPFNCNTFYLWDSKSYEPYYGWRQIEYDETGAYLRILVNTFLNNYNEISRGLNDSYFGWKMSDDFLPGEQLMWMMENFEGLDMGGYYYEYLNTQWDEQYRGNRYVFSELKRVFEATISSATATNNITDFVDYGSDDSGDIEIQSRIKFDFSEYCYGDVTIESIDSNPIFILNVNISNPGDFDGRFVSINTSGGVGIFDKQNDPDVAEQQLNGKYLTLSVNTNIDNIQSIVDDLPYHIPNDSYTVSFDSHNNKCLITVSLQFLYDSIYNSSHCYGPYDAKYQVHTQWQGNYTPQKTVKLIEINMP